MLATLSSVPSSKLTQTMVIIYSRLLNSTLATLVLRLVSKIFLFKRRDQMTSVRKRELRNARTTECVHSPDPPRPADYRGLLCRLLEGPCQVCMMLPVLHLTKVGVKFQTVAMITFKEPILTFIIALVTLNVTFQFTVLF